MFVGFGSLSMVLNRHLGLDLTSFLLNFCIWGFEVLLLILPCSFFTMASLLFINQYMWMTQSSLVTIKFLDSLISQLSEAFELKDLGLHHYFLGLQITRSSKGLFLSQAKYAQDLLLKLNMHSSKPARSPCAPHIRLVPNEGSFLPNPHEYRSFVGSLHYLIFKRPDLSFAMHQICQFMSFPIDIHLAVAKRILRYINGTLNFGILLQFGPISLSAFSDSNWVSDHFDRRFTTSFIAYLGYNPITQSAKKQDIFSRSFNELEYCALAFTVVELSWLRQVLQDLPLFFPKTLV